MLRGWSWAVRPGGRVESEGGSESERKCVRRCGIAVVRSLNQKALDEWISWGLEGERRELPHCC